MSTKSDLTITRVGSTLYGTRQSDQAHMDTKPASANIAITLTTLRHSNMSFDLDIPDLPEEIETHTKGAEDTSGGALTFGVIGAGQCGGRLAEAFQNLGYGKAISLNTTDQDKNGVRVQLILKEAGSHGGAGKDPAIAKKAITQNIVKVYQAVNDTFGTDLYGIIICVGLGGGTGTGSVLDLVAVAHKHLSKIGVENPASRITVIATLPSKSERLAPVVRENADKFANELSSQAILGSVGQVLYVDNEKLIQLLRSLPPTQVYPKANEIVAQLFSVFNKIANTASELTTFDRTDYTKVLEAGGHTLMGATTIKSLDPQGVAESLRKNFANPLLSSGYDLSTAKAVAMVVNAPTAILNTVGGLTEALEHGFATVSSICGNATLFRGIYGDPDAKDLKVYTLVSGLMPPSSILK